MDKMPDPKNKKKNFDAQADLALSGVRIVPRPANIRRTDKETGCAEGSSPMQEAESPEPALVSRLIDFIKSM